MKYLKMNRAASRLLLLALVLVGLGPAAVPAGTTLRTAIVSLKTNGSSLSARFETLDKAAKAGTAVSAAYACPMNCEGSASDKPGSCPKCGMALVKKS